MKYKLKDGAFPPLHAYEGDAGIDLRTPVDVYLPAGSNAVIDTGVCFEIPHGYYGTVCSKSGLNVKKSIICPSGTIDETYRGTPLYPEGIVVHSTGVNQTALARYVSPCDDDPNKDAIIKELGKNIYNNSWNRPGVDKLVHFMIGYGANPADGIKVAQLEPCDRKCGGVGVGVNGSYNSTHIQFEILEDGLDNESYFNAAFDKAIELCAYLCKTWGIEVKDICSHKECAERGYGSYHGDPENWLSKFGKNMDWFRERVAERISRSLSIGDIVRVAPGTKTVNGATLAGWVTDGRPLYVMAVNDDRVTVTVDDSLSVPTGTVFASDILNDSVIVAVEEVPDKDAAKENAEIALLKSEMEELKMTINEISKELTSMNIKMRQIKDILEN